jgi:hypothetical protein
MIPFRLRDVVCDDLALRRLASRNAVELSNTFDAENREIRRSPADTL